MSRSLAIAFLAFVSVTIVLPPTPSAAQRVWVGDGGVRVRAPFVRVDVGPYGGVSVRAPFTSVDVPPRGYYYDDYPPPVLLERRIVEPAYPTAASFAAMDDEQLNQALEAVSEDLHRQLARFNTSDSWQRYLRLPREAVDVSLPGEKRLAARATMLERFQYVAADPQYPMIVRLPAFQAMLAVLSEAVARSDSAAAPNQAEEVAPDQVEAEELPPPLPPQTQRNGREQRDGPFMKPRPRQ
jgi:hypothetical protein